MHKEIRGTDMQWLAEGWWGFYFRRRKLGKVKGYEPIALIAALVGPMLLFAAFFIAGGLFERSEPDVLSALPDWALAIMVIGAILGVIGFILLFRMGSIERRERETFVDYVIDQWEEGSRDLPDAEGIAEYLKKRELMG
jgi:hypothetical protein